MSLRPASSRLRGTWQAILGLLVMAALAGFMALEASAVAWERLDAGEMVVMYAPGYLQDAELFGTWAQETHDLVTQFLELESVPEVIVYLYPEEEWERSPYIAYAQPRNRSVHFLTPSDNPHVSATWYRKNLIHEYSHVAVHHRVGRKFWGYRRLPEWFNEGLAEYIAVMGSDDEIQAA